MAMAWAASAAAGLAGPASASAPHRASHIPAAARTLDIGIRCIGANTVRRADSRRFDRANVRLGRHATKPRGFITRIRGRGQVAYLRGEVGYFEDLCG